MLFRLAMHIKLYAEEMKIRAFLVGRPPKDLEMLAINFA